MYIYIYIYICFSPGGAHAPVRHASAAPWLKEKNGVHRGQSAITITIYHYHYHCLSPNYHLPFTFVRHALLKNSAREALSVSM